MADLISRAAACKCIGKMIHEYREKGEDDLADGMILARRYGIKCLPAVDAVPVVRCRDCKYYAINRLTKAYEPDKRFNPSVCIIGEFARPRKPDWYCADGERRDDDAVSGR